MAKRARKVERERNTQARATGADNLAPLGREREREREREEARACGRGLSLIGWTNLSGGARTRLV